MGHVNIEIKAKCSDPERVCRLLQADGAEYVGLDEQRDTYFPVKHGRLKLREGTIENALIHYRRDDTAGPKRSDVLLYHPEPDSSLKRMLSEALGVDVVVEKRRRIYFIDNVKIHVDDVASLGSFVEIEAIDADGSRGVDALRAQCEAHLKRLGIREDDLVSQSYSDLLRGSA